MPFNGSGQFTRLYNWTQDAANGINILPARLDGDASDLAAGLSDCLTRDGQAGMLAPLNFGGFAGNGLAMSSTPLGTDAANVAYVITASGNRSMGGYQLNLLANPTLASDAANKAYVDAAVGNYAPLASPSLTGSASAQTLNVAVKLTAPTLAPGTNSNDVATMAALLTQAFAASLPNQSAATVNMSLYTNGSSAAWGFAQVTHVATSSVNATPACLLSLENASVSTVTANPTPSDHEEFAVINTNKQLNLIDFGAKSLTLPAATLTGLVQLDLSYTTWRFKYMATLNTWVLAA